jgi:hypothetical protein
MIILMIADALSDIRDGYIQIQVSGYVILVGKYEERDLLGDLSIDGETISTGIICISIRNHWRALVNKLLNCSTC